MEKEHKEILRIGQLVRFFELDTCLSYNLSRYFDDQNTPQYCGHCSVCRGNVAKLTYSADPVWPDESQIRTDLFELQTHVKMKGILSLSLDTQCRFLAGMMVPLLVDYRSVNSRDLVVVKN